MSLIPVQEILEKIYCRIKNLKLKELSDTPDNYGKCKQVLKSYGDDPSSCCPGCIPSINTHWDFVKADEVYAKLLDSVAQEHDVPVDSDVQKALDFLLKQNNHTQNLLGNLQDRFFLSSGLLLYVDYTRSTSGNGLTPQDAFRSFQDCFTTIREKFTAPNAIFNSRSWIPMFKVIAKGNPNQSTIIEPGDWRFQNITLELEFQTDFMHQTSIWGHTCTLVFSGTGKFNLNGAFYCTSSSLEFNNTIENNNVLYNSEIFDYGCPLRLRSSNLIVNGSFLGKGATGIQTSGCAIHINGSIITYGSEYPGELVNTDIAIVGTFIMDALSQVLPDRILPISSCTFRSNGVVGLRGPHLFNCAVLNNGVLKTGSQYSAPKYGFTMRGGMMFGTGEIEALGPMIPQIKGQLSNSASIYLRTSTRPQWPGTEDWKIKPHSYYESFDVEP